MVWADSFPTDGSFPTGVFPLHFDVSEHVLKTTTLLVALKSTTSLIETVSQNLITPVPKVEFYISQPEEGGWLANIFVSLAFGAAGTILVPVVDQAFYDFFGVDLNAREITTQVTGFMKDATTKILKTPNVEIEQCLPDSEFLDKIITSKSDLMRQCQRDRDISGIGFTPRHHFPISRDQFGRHISPRRRSKKVKKQYLLDAYIVAPVLLERHEKDSWTIEPIKGGGNIKAKMHDKSFSRGVLSQKYALRAQGRPDAVTLLIEEHIDKKTGKASAQNRFIKSVLKFNGVALRPMPTQEDMTNITSFEGSQNLVDLFTADEWDYDDD